MEMGVGGAATPRKENEKRQTRLLPGTDDQFVLAGVKGQLGVIHRALCFEPENPRLHLCHRQDTATHVSQSERSIYDSRIDESSASKNHRLPERPDSLIYRLFFVLPFFSPFSFSFFFPFQCKVPRKQQEFWTTIKVRVVTG